ncbi:MAG: hypothetical protein ACTSUT_05595 [Promethearchaeota archaeon]
MWVTICFDTQGDFVDEKYKLKYNGHKIEILRGSEVRGHELYIETEKNYRDGFETGCQFLSEISWLNRTPVHILTTGGSGRKTSCNVWGRRFNRFEKSVGVKSLLLTNIWEKCRGQIFIIDKYLWNRGR